jgi:hypothetical protein
MAQPARMRARKPTLRPTPRPILAALLRPPLSLLEVELERLGLLELWPVSAEVDESVLKLVDSKGEEAEGSKE